MSSLPPGQFADYLIIGVLVAVAAVILEPLFKDRFKSKPLWTRIVALAVICTIAVLSYLTVRWVLASHQEVQVGIGPSPSPKVAPTASPEATALQIHTVQPTNSAASFEELFIRENVAPPVEGARREGQWAVVIAEPESQNEYPKLATAVAAVISSHGQSTLAIFKPAVKRKLNFDSLFNANPVLNRLMARYCDYIFVGKVTMSVSENTLYAGLISVTLVLDAKIISTKSGGIENQFQVHEVGAGSNMVEARANAQERLADTLDVQMREMIR
jgi:hypothetical protein